MKSIALETYCKVIRKESLYKHQSVSKKSENSDVPPISLITAVRRVNTHIMFLSESPYQKAQTISPTIKTSGRVKTYALNEPPKITRNDD
jgi:hypothetical protein